MASKAKSVADLYAEYQRLRAEAKVLYDQADIILKRLVIVWKKDKTAKIDEKHYLQIEDKFRGSLKAFAPGFAHRYDLKEKAVE
jgi:hypothetical protein